jgi:voltage-gated potassium channel
LIVGMRRADGATLLNPTSKTVLSAGDVVVVLGHADDIPKLAERVASGGNRITYRGVSMEAT